MTPRPWLTLVVFTALACGACAGDTTSSAGDAGTNTAGGGSGPASGGGGSSSDGGAIGAGGSAGSTSAGGQQTSGGAGGQSTAGAGGTAGGGGGSSLIECTASPPLFPTFDKRCATAADCVLLGHTTDCCGGQLQMAINQGEQARFAAAESICQSQYPGCGCAAPGVHAEDGTLVPWNDIDTIVVACTDGACRSHVPGGSYTCGDVTCASGQRCDVMIGGPAGSLPSYSCTDAAGCSDCACVGSTPGCDCDTQTGFLRLTCYAP